MEYLSFDEYLTNFGYDSRVEMKINSQKMLEMVSKGEAVVIDIRFEEEFEAWHMGFVKNVPLNQLPKRLNELPKDKLIITACPHNDRANMARMFLTLKGFKAKYLNDGLLHTADILRGGNAKDFINKNKKGE